MDLHDEAVLPVSRLPANTSPPTPAPGWAIRPLRLEIADSYNGCAAFQMDTPSGTEIVD